MLVHILIFIIILFLYLHITDQYKKGEDLEIYEMDYIDNHELQEVCNIKQPIVFHSPQTSFFDKMKANIETHYGSYEVKVKDTVDYENAGAKDSVECIVLPLQSTQNLMMTDTQGHYFSEENGPFLEESGLTTLYRDLDPILKPAFIIQTADDLLFGSKNTCTPLRYHTHYRKFLCVVSGRVQIKCTPWKSSKYLNPIKDYENYDFRSQYNPWLPNLPESPLRFLDAEASAGQIIYIPPYWWYSIQFVGETPAYLSVLNYHSAMNLLAHSPDLVFYFLQNQNIQKKYTKHSREIIEETPSQVDTVKEDAADLSGKEATMNLTKDLS